MSLLLLFKSSGSATAYSLDAAAGSYALTGQSATLLKALSLNAAAGTFTLSGQDAELVYSGSVTPAVVIKSPQHILRAGALMNRM